MAQTFFQVFPRYTAGSPAQVDEAQARRVADAEKAAFRDLLASGTDVDRCEAGLSGIVEQVTDFEARRVIVDLITDRRREFVILDGRVVFGRPFMRDVAEHLGAVAVAELRRDADKPRIELVPPTVADVLKADLRMLQDLANRRGGAWLIKWASLFQGVNPGDMAINLKAAEASGDPAFLDYVKDWPFGPDPRD